MQQQQPSSSTSPIPPPPASSQGPDAPSTTSGSAGTTDSHEKNTNNIKKKKNADDSLLQVIYLHLDLGIGGAEQLILQLAHASVDDCHHSVTLLTTRCEPHHCFASVKPDGGRLYKNLVVVGQWIPRSIGIFGTKRILTAFCSTLRVLYLAYWIIRHRWQTVDLIVVDVLPTPLPLLRYFTRASLLFYCHFPDQLLSRNNHPNNNNTAAAAGGFVNRMQKLYRTVMDWVEDQSMSSADLVVVNSQFTRSVVLNTFPSLQSQCDDLPVLYPALDTASLTQTLTLPQQQQQQQQHEQQHEPPKRDIIVSLNRFERKKNLSLLLHAAAWIQKNSTTSIPLPRIVVAGGYDVHNVENVEHRAELQLLTDQLQLQHVVEFQHSISDAQRAALLQRAIAVVYTPEHEHFGIVPLEAMYAGAPVVCCRSGGPVETVLHGTTGFLCDATAASFGQALLQLLQDDALVHAMGMAGRKHVEATFGPERFAQQWNELTRAALVKGRKRIEKQQQEQQGQHYRLVHALVYLLEAVLLFVLCWCLTVVLRALHVLQPNQSLWSVVQQAVGWKQPKDEL